MEERNERVLSYGETYLGIVYRQNDGRYAIEGQDGRLFFPHRSWSDLRPGICKITYIRDKGTYGFITGQFTRSDVPKESRVATRLLETAQSIAPEELFVKQQITSDLYGRVVVITHGFSEVLHVIYNSVDDPERKERVLSIGRRIDLAPSPLHPMGACITSENSPRISASSNRSSSRIVWQSAHAMEMVWWSSPNPSKFPSGWICIWEVISRKDPVGSQPSPARTT